jgi:hypothetical protein
MPMTVRAHCLAATAVMSHLYGRTGLVATILANGAHDVQIDNMPKPAPNATMPEFEASSNIFVLMAPLFTQARMRDARNVGALRAIQELSMPLLEYIRELSANLEAVDGLAQDFRCWSAHLTTAKALEAHWDLVQSIADVLVNAKPGERVDISALLASTPRINDGRKPMGLPPLKTEAAGDYSDVPLKDAAGRMVGVVTRKPTDSAA